MGIRKQAQRETGGTQEENNMKRKPRKAHVHLLRLYESTRRIPDNDAVIVFDTSINSHNTGDEIIMSYCDDILKECYGSRKRIHVPTHTLPAADELDSIRKAKHKIVCGTNILSPIFNKFTLWKMPEDLRSYSDVITLGVGWSWHDIPLSGKSRDVYRCILSKHGLHSVRDSFTERMMREMGFENVLNTGCPTLWGLTPEHCRGIPSGKASKVVTALTGWTPDEEADRFMLESLEREYEKVYIRMQGNTDHECFSKIYRGNGIEILPPDLNEFTTLLRNGDVDYVGNRLHAGIHAMNCKARALIIFIYPRAAEMKKDFDLPVIARRELVKKLSDAIRCSRETVLNIPWENIDRWKAQFHGMH